MAERVVRGRNGLLPGRARPAAHRELRQAVQRLCARSAPDSRRRRESAAPEWYSAWAAVSSTFVVSLLALFVYFASAPLLRAPLRRAILAASFLVLPVLPLEVLAALCNLQWFLLDRVHVRRAVPRRWLGRHRRAGRDRRDCPTHRSAEPLRRPIRALPARDVSEPARRVAPLCGACAVSRGMPGAAPRVRCAPSISRSGVRLSRRSAPYSTTSRSYTAQGSCLYGGLDTVVSTDLGRVFAVARLGRHGSARRATRRQAATRRVDSPSLDRRLCPGQRRRVRLDDGAALRAHRARVLVPARRDPLLGSVPQFLLLVALLVPPVVGRGLLLGSARGADTGSAATDAESPVRVGRPWLRVACPGSRLVLSPSRGSRWLSFRPTARSLARPFRPGPTRSSEHRPPAVWTRPRRRCWT